MALSEWFIYGFSFFVLIAVMYILLTKNVIRAAFSLVICFVGLAGLYVLLQAEFMAVVQILIYVGGIIVLLIFGIFLTRTISEKGVITSHRLPYLGGVMGIVLFTLVSKWVMEANQTGTEITVYPSSIKQIGLLMMTNYILAFELIAFILLLVLIGAAYIAKKSTS